MPIIMDPEAKPAQGTAPAETKPDDAANPSTSEWEALLRGLLQGVSFNTADEIESAVRAMAAPGKYGDNFEFEQAKQRVLKHKLEQEHGGTYLAGELAGGVLPALAIPGAGALKTGKTGWALVKALASQGAKYGAAAGAVGGAAGGEGDAADLETLKKRGAGALTGGAVGGALGGALPFIIEAFPAALAYVKRTAQRAALGGTTLSRSALKKAVQQGSAIPDPVIPTRALKEAEKLGVFKFGRRNDEVQADVLNAASRLAAEEGAAIAQSGAKVTRGEVRDAILAPADLLSRDRLTREANRIVPEPVPLKPPPPRKPLPVTPEAPAPVPPAQTFYKPPPPEPAPAGALPQPRPEIVPPEVVPPVEAFYTPPPPAPAGSAPPPLPPPLTQVPPPVPAFRKPVLPKARAETSPVPPAEAFVDPRAAQAAEALADPKERAKALRALMAKAKDARREAAETMRREAQAEADRVEFARREASERMAKDAAKAQAEREALQAKRAAEEAADKARLEAAHAEASSIEAGRLSLARAAREKAKADAADFNKLVKEHNADLAKQAASAQAEARSVESSRLRLAREAHKDAKKLAGEKAAQATQLKRTGAQMQAAADTAADVAHTNTLNSSQRAAWRAEKLRLADLQASIATARKGGQTETADVLQRLLDEGIDKLPEALKKPIREAQNAIVRIEPAKQAAETALARTVAPRTAEAKATTLLKKAAAFKLAGLTGLLLEPAAKRIPSSVAALAAPPLRLARHPLLGQGVGSLGDALRRYATSAAAGQAPDYGF